MPASGPVLEPKLLPAATMEDQEADVEPIVLGTPPFSSPDPATDAKKMLPLSDGTSAYEAHEASSEERRLKALGTNYNSLDIEELKTMADERDLSVKRTDEKEVTGKTKLRKVDYIDALQKDDTANLQAGDFKAAVEAAEDQDALDKIVEAYENDGRSYSTVDAAIDKKQEELDNPATDDDE